VINYDEDCDSPVLLLMLFIGTLMSVNSLRLSSIVLISGTRRIDVVRDDEARRTLFDVMPLSSILAWWRCDDASSILVAAILLF